MIKRKCEAALLHHQCKQREKSHLILPASLAIVNIYIYQVWSLEMQFINHSILIIIKNERQDTSSSVLALPANMNDWYSMCRFKNSTDYAGREITCRANTAISCFLMRYIACSPNFNEVFLISVSNERIYSLSRKSLFSIGRS